MFSPFTPFLALALMGAGLWLWGRIVPVVQRFGLTPATLGGLIACAFTAASAAPVVCGLVLLVDWLY